MTKDELLASVEKFKTDVEAFAKKTVVSRTDGVGQPIPEGNPGLVTTQGEESKVGHIFAAIETYVKPLIEELEGESSST